MEDTKGQQKRESTAERLQDAVEAIEEAMADPSADHDKPSAAVLSHILACA